MALTLLTGEAALAHAGACPFQANWNGLHGLCPWASACQHPDFVLPWYRLYGASWVPVIVADVAGDGALAGFFPLALSRDGQRLVGAGAHQAEYQGWLQAPDAGAAFIVAALRALRARFPVAALTLKYLPPETPLSWLDEAHGAGTWWSARSTLSSTRRPLMHIEPAAMARQRNKKNHRQNFNRLTRLGEVRFQKIVEHGHFLAVFDELCDQYDVRQAALYRDRPFAVDAAKKDFYRALHKNGLLHVTILTVGGTIAASHIGLLSQGRAVHLGINTINPAMSAHSPGNLLLAMLGVQLAAENLPLLDLTPGGDGYKEHFATGHDLVAELAVFHDLRSFVATQARQRLIKMGKALLHKTGYRRHDVLALVHRIKALKRAGLANWWKQRRARS